MEVEARPARGRARGGAAIARLLEDTAKELLRRAGLAVPRGEVAEAPGRAADIAARLGGGVMIKALVPAGKRRTSAGVRAAFTPEETELTASRLLSSTIAGFPVSRVLVEERVAIDRELYAAITIDDLRGEPVALASLQGGSGVEDSHARNGSALASLHFDPLWRLPLHRAVALWSNVGLGGRALRGAAVALTGMSEVFRQRDLMLLEVNPLAVTEEGQLVAVDALARLDDSALFRQPELRDEAQRHSGRSWRPVTELERRAQEIQDADPYRGTARYTELEGDIGFMCGGGGASLVLFDEVLDAGLDPANYTEFGGNPSEEKVYQLARVILSKRGLRGMLLAMSITNNTQVDIVARGVTRALADEHAEPSRFPVACRLAGVGDDEARRICEEAGLQWHGEDATLGEIVEELRTKVRASEGRP